jgi:hypothetical protein
MSKALVSIGEKIEAAKKLGPLKAGKKIELAERALDEFMKWALDTESRINSLEAQLSGDAYDE